MGQLGHDGQKNQMAWLVGDLRKISLTWFMNFTDNQTRLKEKNKNNFMSFFKT
jgi:hypothetical protein